jgi:hypothetical protein
VKTISEQLDAARRELGMRQRVYPGWVNSGKMTREKAEHETDCMRDIVATLETLKMLREVSEEMKKGTP